MSLHAFLSSEIDPSDQLDSLIFSLAQLDITQRGPAMRKLTLLNDPRLEDRLFAVLQALDYSGGEHTHSLVEGQEMHHLIRRILLRRGKIALPALFRSLKVDNTPVQEVAIEALGELGDPQNLASILQVIRIDQLTQSRCEYVIEALSKLVTPSTVEILLPFLLDGQFDEERSVRIASTLLKPAGPATVTVLLPLLSGRNTSTCCLVASLLGHLDDPRITPVLITTLDDQESEVRIQAAQALGRLGNPAAADALIATANDTDGNVRAAALNALGKVKDPRTVEVLIAALADKDEDVRSIAIWNLGLLGDSHAVEPLLATLNDPNETIRSRAIDALAAVGDVRTLEPLIAILDDAYLENIRSAVQGLEKLGDSHAVEPLIAALARVQDGPPLDEPWDTDGSYAFGIGDAFGPARHDIVYTLGKLADPRATNTLIASLDDPGYWIHTDAIKGLGLIGNQKAVETLITLLVEKHDSRAAIALGTVGGSRAIKTLVRVVTESEKYPTYVWKSAAQALRTLQRPAPAILFTRLSQLQAPKDRSTTIRTLGLLGDLRAFEPLLTVLNNPKEESMVRAVAAHALGELGDERAIVPLVALLKSDSPLLVRGKATQVLGLLKNVQALAPLIAVLEDKEPTIRALAAKTLGELGNAQALPALQAMEKREITRDDDFQNYNLQYYDAHFGDSERKIILCEDLPEDHAANAISRIQDAEGAKQTKASL